MNHQTEVERIIGEYLDRERSRHDPARALAWTTTPERETRGNKRGSGRGTHKAEISAGRTVVFPYAAIATPLRKQEKSARRPEQHSTDRAQAPERPDEDRGGAPGFGMAPRRPKPKRPAAQKPPPSH